MEQIFGFLMWTNQCLMAILSQVFFWFSISQTRKRFLILCPRLSPELTLKLYQNVLSLQGSILDSRVLKLDSLCVSPKMYFDSISGKDKLRVPLNLGTFETQEAWILHSCLSTNIQYISYQIPLGYFYMRVPTIFFSFLLGKKKKKMSIHP